MGNEEEDIIVSEGKGKGTDIAGWTDRWFGRSI